VTLEISLLGPPLVRRDGRPVGFDTRKATALLAHLALAERPRSRESLCGLLWPALDPEHARGALRRTLSTLRRAVGGDRLDTAGDSVALRFGDGLELDVRRFRELAGEEAPAESLAAAAELFRGELLEGFSLRDSPEFDDWQMGEGDALRRELASVLSRLVELLAARGDCERALAAAARWLDLDRLHEPAHRALIRLYAWNGDRAAALGQYRDCVRTLTHELGVTPVEETAALFEQVSDGALAPPAPARASATTSPAAPPPAAPTALPLTGRAADLEALVAAHRSVDADGRLAVAEGEAGVGKSRLAAELIETVCGLGASVVAARCHDDEAGLAYGAAVELLRATLELTGSGDATSSQHLADASLLVPELAGRRADLPPPLSLEGPGARARLLEAVAGVLSAACAGPVPGVVFVDDVQLADEATLDAIAYLGHRLAGRPLLLLLSWRSEGVPPGHRMRRLAVDLQRGGRATLVHLDRLDEKEVASLVRASRPGTDDLEFERRIYRESEGLPLFVDEYLAAMRSGESAVDGLSGEVRGLLGARLAGLDSVARQVLGAAAVIGRSFDLETVREASGRADEETAGALEELIGRGIVREPATGEAAYDFSHQKLRALVYEEVGLARRRLLHRRVAVALGRGSRDGEAAALVAQHLRLAGDHDEAARQYLLAADHAAALLAHANALEHLEAALTLGHPDAAALHERIGDLRTLIGDYGEALASYRRAAALCDPSALAGVEHKRGEVHARRGEWGRAESHLAAALAAAAASEHALRARIQADLSLNLHRTGHPEHALALAGEALALAERAPDRRARAQAHNMLGVLARTAGELDGARSELERSLALSEELHDPSARTAALNNLALVWRELGDLDRALELTQRALEVCVAYGDRHREAALHNNLADLHHEAGRTEASMGHLRRAVAIFSEVGADGATRLPEIWKLVSW
jgi:DNA-binding SARP family transcriptional activator/predicted ATPase